MKSLRHAEKNDTSLDLFKTILKNFKKFKFKFNFKIFKI